MERFDGETFSQARDGARLTAQLERVQKLMEDHQWRTLAQISAACEDAPEPSVSARLRDLRKPRFGGYTVERRYVADGVWEYRVAPFAEVA